MLHLASGKRPNCQEFKDCCDDKKHDRRHPTIDSIAEHAIPLAATDLALACAARLTWW